MVRPVAQGVTAFRRCPLLDVTHRRAGHGIEDLEAQLTQLTSVPPPAHFLSRLTQRECARPLVAGLASGSLLAAGLAHFARGLLFGLDGIDVGSQALEALTLLAIGLMASYPPARRATRVDPLVALRHQ